MNLSEPGRLRIAHLQFLLSCCRQHIYDMEKRGQIPRRDGNDGRPFWYTATILHAFPNFLDGDADGLRALADSGH